MKLESPTAVYICWEDLDNVAFCRINNDKAELEKSQCLDPLLSTWRHLWQQIEPPDFFGDDETWLTWIWWHSDILLCRSSQAVSAWIGLFSGCLTGSKSGLRLGHWRTCRTPCGVLGHCLQVKLQPDWDPWHSGAAFTADLLERTI